MFAVDLPAEPAAVAASPPALVAHFGGPDAPAGALRDILLARIRSAPPGSDIDWATYYFADRELADALIAAHDRGVRVRMVLDGAPRRGSVNADTSERLRQGLGDDFKLRKSWFPGAHLHAKIYAFSGPEPAAFIGSYNPSGGAKGKVLRDIGDQDRGENLLVEIRDPMAVRALQARVDGIWSGSFWGRFGIGRNKARRFPDLKLYAFPRLNTGVVERRLAKLGPGDRVEAAVSHMDNGSFAQALAAAAQRGVEISLVVHDTRRRVPGKVVRALDESGVEIRRYCDPENLPMHAKFVIMDHKDVSTAWFGSLNYNLGSRLLNQEVLARSSDPDLVASLKARFQVIEGSAAQRTCERKAAVTEPETPEAAPPIDPSTRPAA